MKLGLPGMLAGLLFLCALWSPSCAAPAPAVDDLQTLSICGVCEQIKGSLACCVPADKPCPDCGYYKGSADCCSPIEAEDIRLCPQCGGEHEPGPCPRTDEPRCPTCHLLQSSRACPKNYPPQR